MAAAKEQIAVTYESPAGRGQTESLAETGEVVHRKGDGRDSTP
jgi:hypothetical protein